ncbi:GntR family transcriptional regulator [Leucobacter sp. M11]|uniref:GntR family transcriptional regulator n=1 Tax=Leucobacter sp. M11 TaxID=2993565 RepID=UPI002D7EEB61|nr:GntR family transcriptional regulator [Leucobacter sp. M11]MEB4615307.1 GntR family transcriptional regulator [Leucobacter sp. M11]
MTRAAAVPSEPGATRASRGDELVLELRDGITAGVLRPGDQLSETALAERHGVSRNTLREAFRALVQEGLLVHRPHRGVFVAVPSLSAIIDIYRVRRLIEGPALEMTFPQHPASLRMRAAVERAQAAREAGDWPAVGTANMAFHAAVVDLADSERLTRLFAQLAAELRLAFGLLDDPEFLHAPYLDQNVRILELFEAGQRAEAAALLDAYLVQSERTILAAYARHLKEHPDPSAG